MKANKSGKRPTIGIFSSSSPISATVPVRYERGKQYLENKGFKVIDGSLYGKQDFYRSGTIKEPTDECINWARQDRLKEERTNEWWCINPGVCQDGEESSVVGETTYMKRLYK